jgi:hypothetical protein
MPKRSINANSLVFNCSKQEKNPESLLHPGDPEGIAVRIYTIDLTTGTEEVNPNAVNPFTPGALTLPLSPEAVS